MLRRVLRYRKPAPEGTSMSLVFEPNGTDHDDLVLRVGSWAHRSDSYYHVLDPAFESGGGPAAAVRALLAQWKSSIRAAKNGAPFYLPHDFSDQCTGWLRGVREGDAVELVAGWSLVEGYTFFPSDHAKWLARSPTSVPSRASRRS